MRIVSPGIIWLSVIATLTIGVIGIVSWSRNTPNNDGQGEANNIPAVVTPGKSKTTLSASTARPTSSQISVPADLDQPVTSVAAALAFKPQFSGDDAGRTPVVTVDAHPSLGPVVEAALQGTHPERLTPLIDPAPFDAAAYAANPAAYCALVEPGRVYQTAQPGAGVPALDLLGTAAATIAQGTTTLLRVKATAGAPVTFTSFDCGAFSNLLTSITVTADTDGVATATFLATPGTLNETNILAASPLCSGQVNFSVTILPAIAHN